jgi:hypothetical protein
MILVLRGHIRDSFNSDRLYNLVKLLHTNFNLTIYIHTWHIVQSSLSYREINEISLSVTKEMIEDYFKDLKSIIRHIIIDNDTEIDLIGKTSGYFWNESAPVPVLGWKNYWYGKYRIISYLYNTLYNRDEMIINMRFDVLNNRWASLNEKLILLLILNNRLQKFEQNIFIWPDGMGADNLYVGNINTMYKLNRHFYYNMDDIVRFGKNNSYFHELYVPNEDYRIFGSAYKESELADDIL